MVRVIYSVLHIAYGLEARFTDCYIQRVVQCTGGRVYCILFSSCAIYSVLHYTLEGAT